MNLVKMGKRPDTLPKRNALLDFDIGENRYARVSVEVLESPADRILLKLQAFEIDASGNFVHYNTGAPSRTPSIVRAISSKGLGDTFTLKPGWVRVVSLDGGPIGTPPNLREEKKVPTKEPKDKRQWVKVDETYYRWDAGEVAKLAHLKALELKQLVDLTPDALDISI